MNKYILIFSVTYIAGLIAFIILSELFDIGGSGSSGVLIAGGIVAGMSFAKDHNRAPDSAEKKTLVWGSFISAVLISCLLVLGFLLISEESAEILETLSTIPVWIWLIAFIVMSLIYVALLTLCYGWLTSKLFVRSDL